jgi:hypothetical protein
LIRTGPVRASRKATAGLNSQRALPGLGSTPYRYYAAGFYLLSTAIRSAIAYFGHLRRRIRALSREAVFPRDDVASLKHLVDTPRGTVPTLQTQLRQAHKAPLTTSGTPSPSWPAKSRTCASR